MKTKYKLLDKYGKNCKCGKRIWKTSKSCNKCRNRINNNLRFRPKKGSRRSSKIRKKISIAVRNATTIHHIDGNHKNNKKLNKIEINMILHSYIHQNAYKFIVTLGNKMLLKYLNWLENYKSINLQNFEDKLYERN